MVRRVVTGVDGEGKSVFISDEEIEGVALPGFGLMTDVWGTDSVLDAPNSGTRPEYSTFFPSTQGFRVWVATFEPDAGAGGEDSFEVDSSQDSFDVEAIFPGLLQYMEPDAPGMHTTVTIDIGFVLSGSVWIDLGDGRESLLNAGDVVVQNGTRHAWRNKSDKPSNVLFVLIGAKEA